MWLRTGMYGHRKRVCTERSLREKSRAAPGNRTCVSGMLVQPSASWTTSPPYPCEKDKSCKFWLFFARESWQTGCCQIFTSVSYFTVMHEENALCVWNFLPQRIHNYSLFFQISTEVLCPMKSFLLKRTPALPPPHPQLTIVLIMFNCSDVYVFVAFLFHIWNCLHGLNIVFFCCF